VKKKRQKKRNLLIKNLKQTIPLPTQISKKTEIKHSNTKIQFEEMPLKEAWEKLNSLTHYEFIQIPIKDVLNVLKLKHGFKDVEKPSIGELNNIKKEK